MSKKYRISNGTIQLFVKGTQYLDMESGQPFEDIWIDVCRDTPENRKKYGL